MKKIMMIIICLVFILGSMTFTSAEIANDKEQKIYSEQELGNMSVNELNQLIDSIMESQESNHEYSIEKLETEDGLVSGTTLFEKVSIPQYLSSGWIVRQNNLRLAWLAAAQIARKSGYPCAAELVECSIYNTPYTENAEYKYTGLFYNKICNTWKFMNARNIAKDRGKYNTSFAFEKSDNADLFYALHNVKFYAANKKGKIIDTFDFAFDNDYNSMFTSCVNNWAWLCQQTGVLYPIDVTIKFTYK